MDVAPEVWKLPLRLTQDETEIAEYMDGPVKEGWMRARQQYRERCRGTGCFDRERHQGDRICVHCSNALVCKETPACTLCGTQECVTCRVYGAPHTKCAFQQTRIQPTALQVEGFCVRPRCSDCYVPADAE